MPQEIATLGGGCFWCLEAVYERMEGVLAVQPGYMGGQVANPGYREVCTGKTGHAEVVQVSFDPAVTPYREVLEVFFTIHDPTTRDRQGNDVGPQYRSVVFYHSPSQRETAESVIRELEAQHVWGQPIVTEVRPAEPFYPAEDYHRQYFDNNATEPYCMLVIDPKVRKFREKYAAKLKAGT